MTHRGVLPPSAISSRQMFSGDVVRLREEWGRKKRSKPRPAHWQAVWETQSGNWCWPCVEKHTYAECRVTILRRAMEQSSLPNCAEHCPCAAFFGSPFQGLVCSFRLMAQCQPKQTGGFNISALQNTRDSVLKFMVFPASRTRPYYPPSKYISNS